MTKVIKLSQPGYDVKTAGDENLIYNSNWPLLKIYKQGSVTIDNLLNVQTVATHDLAYPPLFWYFSNSTEALWDTSSTTVTSEARSEFMGPLGNDSRLGMDDHNLTYINSQATAPTGRLSLYYYIFALDLTKPYQAPSIKLSNAPLGGSGDKVFKLAKPGKDINSHNMGDYIIHSDARSPMIHSVTPIQLGTASNGAYTATITHNLGYVPMFFVFQKSNRTQGNPNAYIPYYTSGIGNLFGTQPDEQKIVIYTLYPQDMSIVILKDPFAIDQTIRVSI